MYCATCLLYGHNFREIDKVQDGSEYWLDVSPLNTEEKYSHHRRLDIQIVVSPL